MSDPPVTPREGAPGDAGDAAPPPPPARDDTPAARRAQRRLAIAAALYVVTTLLYLVTAGRDRLATHTPFNHFALLAESWLEGRLDLGGPPPAYTGNNDFAVHEGKHYISFPPFPALLLVPLVKLAGSAEQVRDGRFFMVLAGVAPAVLFLALEKLSEVGRSRRGDVENAALAVFFALGSVYWFSAVQGTVWFAAHVVGAALACIYLYCCIDAAHPIAAGLALGLGFATRTPLGFAAPLFLYEAVRASCANGARGPREANGASGGGQKLQKSGRALAGRVLLFAAPAAAVLGLLLWHNQARFGDPLEFGHRYLAIVWQPRIERWGLFSYHYLPRNLAVVLTSLPYTGVEGAPFQINAHGLALWVTTPLYAWAIWPRRSPPIFWALAATAAAVALPSLLYQNSGWVQFGYRFSNDFAPFLFAMIAVGGRRFGPAFYALGAAAIAVNAFGALSFQRAGYERFYFFDRTQKILHQPD